MSTTFDDICTFCHEVDGQAGSNLFFDLGLGRSREDYIFHESDHFVVVPCIGALTDWYLLIVSKRHTLSVGWLDEAERADLRALVNEVTELVRRRACAASSSNTAAWTFATRAGPATTTRTSTSWPPTATTTPSSTRSPPPVAMQQCMDWTDSAHRLVQEHQRSYLALGTPGQDWIGQATGAPSQFFRRCLATWMGAEEGTWDWLVFPQAERVQRMITHFAYR
ncbi:HIT family protein [Nocardiopsis salina]|uniref:hypothetical protein n=1 Tax=Nocardiopsis salina TaxID=245836 RepID=UPI00034C79A8|nr:hypothetical protein [Nocardiopsis salina]